MEVRRIVSSYLKRESGLIVNFSTFDKEQNAACKKKKTLPSNCDELTTISNWIIRMSNKPVKEQSSCGTKSRKSGYNMPTANKGCNNIRTAQYEVFALKRGTGKVERNHILDVFKQKVR